MTRAETIRSTVTGPWWLILCLVGLDYFSTLAYLPSLAVQAVGAAAPVAAVLLVLATLLLALPVYCYVVARSPDGTGGTGLLERLVRGWRGKLLILTLLSFVATDYVVTQNLSIADAAEHLRANPLFRDAVQPVLDRHLHLESLVDHSAWRRVAERVDSQLFVTLVLVCASFALWAFWRRISTRYFLRAAAVIVAGYMLLNALVIVSGLVYLADEGRPLLESWQRAVRIEIGSATSGPRTVWQFASLAWLGLVSFPFLALGLSGFELSMAVAPMVRGDATDSPTDPSGRIRNMRKLLVAAAVILSIWLVGAVLVATVLIPRTAYHNHGPAVHRALAYLAHGGVLADGQPSSVANALFGPLFGSLYDVFTVAILCMAGACVIIALSDYVPDYLQRLGMELELAHRLGVRLRFFNVIVVIIGIVFRADIARLQWAYVTSVLALLSGASLAALLSVRCEPRSPWVRFLLQAFALGAVSFFAGMALLTTGINRSGLEIAAAFAVGIVMTSAFSRWFRSTELRFQGFDFYDEESRRLWDRFCAHDFQVLVPHRPGLHSRSDKEAHIRQRHRLGTGTPIILIEAELGDPSEFYQRPLVRVTNENGLELIQVSRCASISHVLAAVSLEMSRVGRPIELHCGWSNESPMAANLNFLLFGEGNIPWMVHELIRKAEPDPAKRPHVILG